jgi:hypothetical protein
MLIPLALPRLTVSLRGVLALRAVGIAIVIG